MDQGNDFAEGGATLDLPALAKIRRGDRVEVQALPDQMEALYEETLHLLPADNRPDTQTGESALDLAADPNSQPPLRRAPRRTGRSPESRAPATNPAPAPSGSDDELAEYLPDTEVLRQRFLLAEAVGGYEALHDLLNSYSPGLELTRRYATKVKDTPLSAREVNALETYQTQIRLGLEKANAYLGSHSLNQFTREEIHDLHDLLTMAAARDKELTRILGAHLIHEVEAAVRQLNELMLKIQSVEQTVTGIFMVESEVMFIPTNELILTVNTLFKAVGNPHLSRHIDGVLLLAARNMLIQVVAFFSYYGKHQIYSLFQKGGSSSAVNAVTFRIRGEVRKLFEACKQDNKLVLTRVMEDTARDFDLSVEAIQNEAIANAVDAVKQFIPAPPPPPPPKRTWLQRLFRWFR